MAWIVLFRFLGILWLILAILIVLRAISGVIFIKEERNLELFLIRIGIALLLPIAVFTSVGRDYIFVTLILL